MADVTMSLEEYLRLVEDYGVRPAKSRGNLADLVKNPSPKKRKRVGKKDPKMARALRKANSMGRKKNGGLKKGWTQGKIMKKAHQLKKRMR